MSFLAQRLVEAFGILSYQWSSLPLSLTRDSCRGKTYIVTGANIGLGYECAKHLVQLGAHRVILAVRSPTRGQAALEALEKETGIRDVAECWLLDLASHQSTVAFAERVKGQLERVDAIVENAASATAEWSIAEGLESNMTVNVVGTLFLAVLLMPYLEQCAMKFNIQPRVSIVISGLGFSRRADLAKIDRANILKDVSDDKKWSIVGTERYSLSKLIQIFAIRAMASRTNPSGTGVIINMIDPGLCKTGLLRYADRATIIAVSILILIMGRSAEWGSRNLLHGIAVGEESHGKYIAYCDIRETE